MSDENDQKTINLATSAIGGAVLTGLSGVVAGIADSRFDNPALSACAIALNPLTGFGAGAAVYCGVEAWRKRQMNKQKATLKRIFDNSPK